MSTFRIKCVRLDESFSAPVFDSPGAPSDMGHIQFGAILAMKTATF